MATQQNNGQEQDLNHLRKVRREKLAEMQANGQNPFEITKYDVTHHSQEVKDNFDELEGKHVVLAGRMMSIVLLCCHFFHSFSLLYTILN